MGIRDENNGELANGRAGVAGVIWNIKDNRGMVAMLTILRLVI